LTPIKKWLIKPLTVVSKNSMRDNKVREAAATVTAAAEEPSKRAENLSMQVNLLHRLYLPVVYPSL